jgi:hypothetical protein
MKVQALLNAVFIKPMVVNDDGKDSHDLLCSAHSCWGLPLRLQPASWRTTWEGVLPGTIGCHRDIEQG